MTWEAKLQAELAKLDGTISVVLSGSLQFAYEAEVVHRLASLVKLPILAAALQRAAQGRFPLAERISCGSLGSVRGSGAVASLSQETELSLADLLTLMITVSDNDATNEIIRRLGLDNLRQDMAATGMTLNRYMMQSPAEAGGDNMGTARQVANLLMQMDQSPLCAAFYAPLLDQQFRQQLPGLLEYCEGITVANKTGSLAGVLHDAARFQGRGGTVYAAVLMSGLTDVAYAAYIQARIGRLIAEQLT